MKQVRQKKKGEADHILGKVLPSDPTLERKKGCMESNGHTGKSRPNNDLTSFEYTTRFNFFYNNLSSAVITDTSPTTALIDWLYKNFQLICVDVYGLNFS